MNLKNVEFDLAKLKIDHHIQDDQEDITEDIRNSSDTESAISDWEYGSDSCNSTCTDKSKEIDIRPCPLRFIALCKWSGPSENPHDMILHCLQEHSKNIFLSDTQKFLVTKFSELIPRKYFIIFCEHSNMFRFTWDLDVPMGSMRFGIYFLYDFGLDLQYVYEIDFLYGRKKMIKLKGPCYYLPDEEEMFLKKIYFTLPFDLVKKYCNSEGNLTFSVKISKDV